MVIILVRPYFSSRGTKAGAGARSLSSGSEGMLPRKNFEILEQLSGILCIFLPLQ